MRLHHTGHHQAYVNNLNKATEQLAQAFAARDLKMELELQSQLKFNGGGHINHSLFWENLTPSNGSVFPDSGPLKQSIEAQFGSVDQLKSTMSTRAAAIQGSGWAWLVYNPTKKVVELQETQNQDPVLGGAVPLLGIDVWEHAYYLDYKNDKASYLKSIWNVINWKTAEKRLVDAQQHNKA